MFPKRNKVLPLPGVATALKGADNVARHASLAAGVPLFYGCLPFTCCCVLPTVRYGIGEHIIQEKKQESPDGELSPPTVFAINFAGMFAGLMSLATGLCCLGCCGTQPPETFFG